MGLWEWLFGSPSRTQQRKATARQAAAHDPREVEANERRADEAALQALTPGTEGTIRSLISEARQLRLSKASTGDNLYDQLNAHGVSQEEMRLAAARALGDTGKAPTLGELLQRISQRFAARPLSDVSGLGVTLYGAAVALNKAGRDDHFPALYEAARLHLLDMERSGMTRAEILTAGDGSCAACRSRKRLVWTVEAALRNMPIPTKRCSFHLNGSPDTRGFCRCGWLPVID